jgi:hypothetical protein
MNHQELEEEADGESHWIKIFPFRVKEMMSAQEKLPHASYWPISAGLYYETFHKSLQPGFQDQLYLFHFTFNKMQMKLKPTLQEVQEMVQSGLGNTIPIYAELHADMLTPVSAYLKVSDRARYSFLLESVAGGETIQRYSFIGSGN